MKEDKCLYESVYTALLEQIRSGKIQPGERLPAEKVLAEKFEVSRITIQKAMGMLVQEGYIVRRPGRGSFASQNIENAEKEEAAAKGGESSGMIGFVMEDFTASFGIELLKAIEEETDRCGYALCVKRSCGDQNREKKMLEALQKMKAAGLIVMPTHAQHYNTEILKMVGEGMPVVFVDRYLEGLPAPFVGTDNKKAIRELMDYLLKKGYRKMALFTAPETDAVSLKERIEGFLEKCREYNLECQKEADTLTGYLLDSIRSTIPDLKSVQRTDADAEQIRRFLEEHKELEVVIAAEFDIAVLTEQVCRQMGIKVPEELVITCFDGPVSAYGDYAYTHVRQDEEGIGRKAVQILMSLMQGKTILDRVSLEAKVIPGRE